MLSLQDGLAQCHSAGMLQNFVEQASNIFLLCSKRFHDPTNRLKKFNLMYNH